MHTKYTGAYLGRLFLEAYIQTVIFVTCFVIGCLVN